MDFFIDTIEEYLLIKAMDGNANYGWWQLGSDETKVGFQLKVFSALSNFDEEIDEV